MKRERPPLRAKATSTLWSWNSAFGFDFCLQVKTKIENDRLAPSKLYLAERVRVGEWWDRTRGWGAWRGRKGFPTEWTVDLKSAFKTLCSHSPESRLPTITSQCDDIGQQMLLKCQLKFRFTMLSVSNDRSREMARVLTPSLIWTIERANVDHYGVHTRIQLFIYSFIYDGTASSITVSLISVWKVISDLTSARRPVTDTRTVYTSASRPFAPMWLIGRLILRLPFLCSALIELSSASIDTSRYMTPYTQCWLPTALRSTRISQCLE